MSTPDRKALGWKSSGSPWLAQKSSWSARMSESSCRPRTTHLMGFRRTAPQNNKSSSARSRCTENHRSCSPEDSPGIRRTSDSPCAHHPWSWMLRSLQSTRLGSEWLCLTSYRRPYSFLAPSAKSQGRRSRRRVPANARNFHKMGSPECPRRCRTFRQDTKSTQLGSEWSDLKSSDEPWLAQKSSCSLSASSCRPRTTHPTDFRRTVPQNNTSSNGRSRCMENHRSCSPEDSLGILRIGCSPCAQSEWSSTTSMLLGLLW